MTEHERCSRRLRHSGTGEKSREKHGRGEQAATVCHLGGKEGSNFRFRKAIRCATTAAREWSRAHDRVER